MTGMDLVPTGGDFPSQGLAHIGGLLQRQTRREVERVVALALIADTREQGRALLANTALENAGSLSALEAHLITIAPLGEDRYKHIVDAYAMGAAETLRAPTPPRRPRPSCEAVSAWTARAAGTTVALARLIGWFASG